jgi:predicted nucleotidyltransferase
MLYYFGNKIKDKIEILKVLVGSRAHGLNDENSDYDYRAVYVLPTSKILSLDYRYQANDWIEGEEDNVSYEIGHFLSLALKCNPSILEVFKAPIVSTTDDGVALRQLFDDVWNPHDTFNAFVGYGLNQRKKLLDKKDNRPNKYGVAYLRTLWNLIELLQKNDFSVKVNALLIKEMLDDIRHGEHSVGEIINFAESMTAEAERYLKTCKHKANKDRVNEFLLAIRQRYW